MQLKLKLSFNKVWLHSMSLSRLFLPVGDGIEAIREVVVELGMVLPFSHF